MLDVEIRGGLSRGEKTGIAAEFVSIRESVERPRESPAPAGILAVALLRALPHKGAGFHVKECPLPD